MSLNPFKGITGSLQRSRNADNAADLESESSIAQMKALGLNEYGMYSGGKLTPGQEKNLAEVSSEETADVEQFSQIAKVSDSFKRSMEDHVKMDSSIMREVFQEGHLQKSIEALGYSWDETQKLLDDHAKDRQQKMQVINGMMGAIGSAVAIFAMA